MICLRKASSDKGHANTFAATASREREPYRISLERASARRSAAREDDRPAQRSYAGRRRKRVVGSFPDGKSALMPACARLRYIASKPWSDTRVYLDMKSLEQQEREKAS